MQTRLDDRAQEFPRMDERRTGLPYRYGYTAATLDVEDVFHPGDTEPADILSAQDFTGDPIATVHLPVRIPLGFHGSWIAG